MTIISDTDTPLLSSKVRVRWDPIRQKYLLLFPEGLFVLNQTAHEIINMCNGKNKVITIVNSLGDKYKTHVDTDIRELLSRLVEKRLLLLSE
ncbi:MAG TPA: pyrroloquinoline quinone biosynthesis peptide chaperone PqqD [Nitrososphaeraceae archaeon]|nr:pyrroloquinoline quinone biosynthesis peptide chaperone PqqD [Nitrososphaeraceae archaeon]